MTKSIRILFLFLFSFEGFGEDLLFDDFESVDNSIVYQSLKKKYLPVEVLNNSGLNNSKGLKVTYESSEIGSKRLTSRIPLSQSISEATLSFDVKFDRDFQFVKGGKLHGLGPRKPILEERKLSQTSKKQKGGISFHKLGTDKADEVRIMPGRLSSPHPTSQKPYVRWKKGGKWLDKEGIPTINPNENHIPLDDFSFKVLE